MFIIITFDFADCFFRLNELHFSLSDYQQALEMDSSDWSVRCRLSIVHNEFGILEYYDRHYLEAIDHLTTSIQYNPRIGAYYLSRARARYMIEVTIKKEFWLNTFFALFLGPSFATRSDEEAWLTARSEVLPKEWILGSHLLMYRRNLTENVGLPFSNLFQWHQYFHYRVVFL